MKKLMFLALFASLAVPQAAKAALTHHWTFNEGTGTTVANTGTVAGFDGTVNGTASLMATGGFDGLGYYEGTGDVGAYISTGLTYDPDAVFSWSAWARNNGTGKQSSAILGNRRNSSGVDFSPREFLKLTPGSTVLRPGDVANTIDHTDLVDTAGWTHFAVVNDGAGNFTTYQNGVATGPATALTGPFTSTALPFHIGGDAGNFGIEFFDGDIDDVRIYNTALSAAEVSVLANVNAIPEPGSLTALLVGGLGVMVRRRKRDA